MFGNSTAIVHTQDKNLFVHMYNLMRQAGFKDTRRFPNNGTMLSEFRRGPLPFIFLHSALPLERALSSFTAVRTHPDVTLRFLPMIVIAESCDTQKLIQFIQLGCDDIITMPITAASILARIKHQIDAPKDYFQTESYFGPDRRQHAIIKNKSHSGRGKGDHYFRHFLIQRHAVRGTSILSSEVHFPANQPRMRASA
jgi:DNA-binding response OmpR family regulator